MPGGLIVAPPLPRADQILRPPLDASMDRTPKDNEFLLLKIIDGDAREDTRFLGIGHVSEGGAKGIYQRLMQYGNY